LDFIVLVSAYFKYNVPTILHTERLDQILNKEKRVLIGADTNGHSKHWHSFKRNKRGKIVEELIDKFDLKVHNVPGKLNTYHRERMGSSNIDATMSTTDIQSLVQKWDVKNVTDSDHRVLCFEIATARQHTERTAIPRFNVRMADWDLFRSTLAAEVGGISEISIDSMAESIDRALALAANRSIGKCRARNSDGRNIWWTHELSALRRDLIRARRQGLRSIDRPAYNVMRNTFLSEIRKQKMAAWKVFANDANVNVWGKAFKWAKNGSKQDNSVPSTLKRPDGSNTTDCRDTADLILSTFVPSDQNQGDWHYLGPLEKLVSPDTTEIKAAIWRIKPSSAPGIDGITAGMLRKAWQVLCGPITDLFGRCIAEGKFPESWKKARLVIIPKPGGGEKDRPKSYRPISLLPVLGKALETIIIKAINRETNLDSFSEQHGFTIGKSTSTAISDLYTWVDATKARHVFGTFLDITGAFDNVKWAPLLEQLRSLGASLNTLRIVNSYLTNRWADYELENVHYSKMLERGCPQGSQLGPTLWKVAITPIYSTVNGATMKLITYADDILLLVGAARPHTAFRRIEGALDHLSSWASRFALEFSASKSQLLSIKGGLKPGYSVGFGTAPNASRIESTATAKYLGVTLDPRRSYWDHIEIISKKSKEMYSRLRALRSANWGLSRTTARILYKSVFLPRVTYAAAAWKEGTKLVKSRKVLSSAQRAPLLAITSAYKTASTNCLAVVAGTLPLDLAVRHSVNKLELRENLITIEELDSRLDALLDEWQARYDSSDKGSWSKYMIPSVRTRYSLPLDLDHYTSQFLTGHGDFYGKLHKFNLVEDPICECGKNPETVRHVLRFCPRTIRARRKLKGILAEEGERWPPEKGAFLKTKRTYKALVDFSKEALTNRSDR